MTSFSISRPANGALPLLQFAGFVVVSGTLLALIGPFGTMPAMGLPARLAHWLGSGLANGLPTFAGIMAVRRFLRPKGAPFWVGMLAAAGAAFPGAWGTQALLRIWSANSSDHLSWAQLFGQCLLLNEVLTCLAFALFRRSATPSADARSTRPGNATDDAYPFASRLPLPLRSARILALTAEDHYLRVHTDCGEALIHMRISDAEALLPAGDGLRVHRSHWVARAAVLRVTRQGGQRRLVLENGKSVPVGRSRVKTLAQAGWL